MASRNFQADAWRKMISSISFPQIYANPETHDFSMLSYPESKSQSHERLLSCLCTKSMLQSDAFRYWLDELGERSRLHRKVWELSYIVQTLHERDKLNPGCRGLGFAVGMEPLSSYFASRGCTVTATDLDAADERSIEWAETGQHAAADSQLNSRNLCSPDVFEKNVSYRAVDMNVIPDDLQDYDFTWSTCSFEHCGSIGLGKRFLREQMKCLKPGGIAVHTTEFNLSSNEDTIDEGGCVIFRRQDVEGMVRDLQADGHYVEPLDLWAGDAPEDHWIDVPPYGENKHLKLELWHKYVSTSIGLIIEKDGLKNSMKKSA